MKKHCIKNLVTPSGFVGLLHIFILAGSFMRPNKQPVGNTRHPLTQIGVADVIDKVCLKNPK
jgi:hypothetical protein